MASTKRGGDKPKNGRANGHAASGHNSEQRATALNEKIEEFCKLQAEEDALIEKYIKPVRDKKNEIKADAKKDYEIPVQAFNARAVLRLIEKADNDEVVLAVNELFKATPVGHNLDLVALAERVEKKKAEKVAAAEAKKTKATATEAAL